MRKENVLIRQIQPLLILQLAIVRLRPKRRFPLVLMLAVPPYKDQVDEAGAPAADDGDFGGDVAWGVFGAECLGT